jgi:hypothetical protein
MIVFCEQLSAEAPRVMSEGVSLVPPRKTS